MSITSLGYENTIFDDGDWANYAPFVAGAVYGVHQNGWEPSAGVGIRAVAIAAGDGWGWGIKDHNSATVTLNHASVSSGQRYDLVVAHRNWATSTTSFEIIQGNSTRAIPTRDTTPGTEDDQPIALVRVVPGSVVAEVIDLRVWKEYARDALVLNYMKRVGTQLRIGSSLWSCELNSSGAAVWVDLLTSASWTNITHLGTAENGSGVYPFSYIPATGGVTLRGVIQKKTGGWSSGDQIGGLPVGARPTQTVRFMVPTATAGQAAKVRVTPTGAIFMDQIVTNGTLPAGANPGWVQFDGVHIPR